MYERIDPRGDARMTLPTSPEVLRPISELPVSSLRLFFFLRFDWSASGDPGIPSAFERAHAREAVVDERQRHTGACAFIRSSAEGDDLAIFGKLRQVLFDLVGRDADCALDRLIARFVRWTDAHIEDGERFAFGQFRFQLFDRDAFDF